MVGLVVVYILRMLVMKFYAFSIRFPVMVFKKLTNLNAILKYSSLIIVAGSIATMLLDIDKVMLGYYVPIEQIAYYNVAIFIAAVIAVPQRSMHQILLPLSAKYLNEKDFSALKDLYKRSSLNLFVVSGFIFLLIVLNVNQLYNIIPEEFNGGLFVVFLISLAKLFDAVLGSNNAILFNSDYYRMVLFFGVVLVVVMVLLNMAFIPYYGINGAALATFLAIVFYNIIKLYFVYKKFKMLPFSTNTLKIGASIFVAVLLFYFWDFSFHPIINILLKSALITILYAFVVYFFRFSENIISLIDSVIKRK